MITAKQIEDLKRALTENNVETLIEKWEAEQFLKEKNKNGNRAFILKNQQTGAQKTVIGKEIVKDFVLHKDAWGGAYWMLTHPPTGIKILSGKKTKLTPVIKQFAEWRGRQDLAEALLAHGMTALRFLPDDMVGEYRKLYCEASL